MSLIDTNQIEDHHQQQLQPQTHQHRSIIYFLLLLFVRFFAKKTVVFNFVFLFFKRFYLLSFRRV